MVLVNTNTSANTSNTIATVPLITCEKYRIAITAATTTRKILSKLPMFFFMLYFLGYKFTMDKPAVLLHMLQISHDPYLVSVKQEFFLVFQFFKQA